MGIGGSKPDKFLAELQECVSVSVAVNESSIECGETTFSGYVRVDCMKAMRRHRVATVTIIASGEVHTKVKITTLQTDKHKAKVVVDSAKQYQLEQVASTLSVENQFTEVGSTQYFPFSMMIPATEAGNGRDGKYIPGTIPPFSLAKSFTTANHAGIPYNRSNSFVDGCAEVLHRVLVRMTDSTGNEQWVASAPIKVVPLYKDATKLAHPINSIMRVETKFLYCIPFGPLTASISCASSAVYKDGVIPCQCEVVNHTKTPVDIITLELKADVCIAVQGPSGEARINGTVHVWSGQLDGVAAGQTIRPMINVPLAVNGIGTQSVNTPGLEIRYYLVLTAKTNCFQDDAQVIISIDVLANNSRLVGQTVRHLSEGTAPRYPQGPPPAYPVDHTGPEADKSHHSFRRSSKVNNKDYQTMGDIPIAEAVAYDVNYNSDKH